MNRRGDGSVAVNPASNVWRRVGAERTLPPPSKPKRERRKGREMERGEKGKEKDTGDQLPTKCKSGGGGGTGVLIGEGARGK